CLPRLDPSAMPLTARLSASVPPDVNTTSLARTPSTAAMRARASARASAARSPRVCELDGLPNSAVRYGHIASSTSRRTGVVAAESRYNTSVAQLLDRHIEPEVERADAVG